MADTLSKNAQKVQEVLLQKGLECQVVELADSTRTAQEAADAIGCQVAQIVKSLVFKGQQTGQPILVVASGVNRVHEKRLGRLVGEKIGKADAEFVRQQTGFPIGGVPPVGHLNPLLTVIDEDLLQYQEVWAAAGTPHAVFKLTPQQLLEMTGGQVASIK